MSYIGYVLILHNSYRKECFRCSPHIGDVNKAMRNVLP